MTENGLVKPVAFLDWIEKIKPELKPPVCNRLLFEKQLQAMIVTGPNVRNDFHIESGEELFYQIQGDMRLDVMEQGKLKPIVIKEGEMFLLPGHIPHSPQRFANTIGLVLERERNSNEWDCLRWYTSDHSKVLYEEWMHCADLNTQLVPVINRFNASEEHKTGIPKQEYNHPKIPIDTTTRLPDPIDFKRLIENSSSSLGSHILFSREFIVTLHNGQRSESEFQTHSREVFLFQIKGSSNVHLNLIGQSEATQTCILSTQHVILIPSGYATKIESDDNSVLLEVTTKSV